MRPINKRFLLLALLSFSVAAYSQQPVSRFETFDRYDPTQYEVAVEGVDGEHIDMRTLGVSWEVTDYVLPGNGGLDITISRSFNKLSHTPSEMGHWYFGVPRIQIPTSPWRAPYDPSYAHIGTFPAAWYNLYDRLGNGASGLCENAGYLVDQSVRSSLTGVLRGGIMYAAPITLYIPGEGAKVLLEKRAGQDQYPGSVRYVTTDNWVARCLGPSPERFWGGFEVFSPDGLRYVFDFIQYMMPGDYATGSTGGWVEMGISQVYDSHGNSIDYVYDRDPEGTDLLIAIESSDGRRVTFDYYPGSILGMDVQGSPLSLITSINIHADSQIYSIEYEYCDFVDFYLLSQGCTAIDLGFDSDLPVLQAVRTPDGLRTEYRYSPSVYSANVLLDWGNFEFQLDSVRLPTGGEIRYSYHPGYHAVLQNSDAPAPRLMRRAVSGRDIETGVWDYTYDYNDHMETTTVTGPSRRDIYEFYEGLGTYEFRIARYPGQHQWPDSSPTDYDELMGLLKRSSVSALDSDDSLQVTEYEYALRPYIGKQFYGSNWLGWPTLLLAQTRQRLVGQKQITDYSTGNVPIQYITRTDSDRFDVYGFPLEVLEGGTAIKRTDYTWAHDTGRWYIGRPDTQTVGDYTVDYDYDGSNLPTRISDGLVTTHFEYDDHGSLTAEYWYRAGIEYRTRYSDYHRGRYRYKSAPIDPIAGEYAVTRQGVNDLGQVTWQDNAAGQRTAFEFDFTGRLLSVAVPETTPVTYEYPLDSNGDWFEIRQAQGNRLRVSTLDGFGRTTRLQDFESGLSDPAARAVSWDFDAAGNLSFSSLPYAAAQGVSSVGTYYDWDEFGRLTREQFAPEGSVREYCYSLGCLPAQYLAAIPPLQNGFVVTDENGYISGYEFSASGAPAHNLVSRIYQQTKHADSDGGAEFRVTSFQRNALGDITRIAQGGLNEPLTQRNYAYTGRRLVSETHPETGLTRHEYDERGNLVATTSSDTRAVHRSYDGLNRLVGIDYPGETEDTQFSYDQAGQLIQAVNAHGLRSYSYDAAQRLARERVVVDDIDVSFDYSYSPSGYLQGVSYPSGTTVDMRPNGFGEPTQASPVVSSAEYWPNGGLRSIRYGNDTLVSYALDPQQRMSGLRVSRFGGHVLFDKSYTYDLSGNLVTATDYRNPAGNVSLAYDGLARLTSSTGYWGSENYRFDAVDNLLEVSSESVLMLLDYGGDNLPGSISEHGSLQTLAHDAQGNLLSDGYLDFEYDEASRLAGVDQLPALQYRYDAHGRRIASRDESGDSYSIYSRSGALMYVNGCEQGGRVSEFVYLGEELVGRMDSQCAEGCHP